jgi:hypothetical protein
MSGMLSEVRILARSLSLLPLLLALAPRAGASVALELTIGDLTREADLVVIGTVRSTGVAWSGDHRRILTRASLEAEEAWKGTLPGSGVVLLLPGGQLDGLSQEISGTPEVIVGERVILFLRHRGDSFRLVGMAQGLFRVPPVSGGTAAVAIRNLDGLKVVAIAPAKAPQPAVLSVPLEALRASVAAAMGREPGR